MNKIRFNDNFCRGQSSRNEFISCEIRQGDVQVYRLRPSAENPMARHHGGHGSGGRPTSAITGIAHPRPGSPFPKATLAGLSVAEQSCLGTQKTIVVERLYHGNPGRSASSIGRWGNQRKRVVKMRHSRLLVKNQVPNLGKTLA